MEKKKEILDYILGLDSKFTLKEKTYNEMWFTLNQISFHYG